jgi:hypothetical protein
MGRVPPKAVSLKSGKTSWAHPSGAARIGADDQDTTGHVKGNGAPRITTTKLEKPGKEQRPKPLLRKKLCATPHLQLTTLIGAAAHG